MEVFGAICEGDWNSSNMFSEGNFMEHLLGNSLSPDEIPLGYNHPFPSIVWSPNLNVDEHLLYLSNEIDGTVYSLPHATNDTSMGMGCHLSELLKDDKVDSPLESKKRPHVATEVERSRRNRKLKKCDNIGEGNNTNTDAKLQGNSSEGICSDNASNCSHKSTHVSSCLSSFKTQVSRGSATDPQSLYARKRRERINERLRILQNLVPNGTKVDISTILEEAVQYVKFLQLQIKVLSSDELWMYAPIAYNGKEIGSPLI